MTLNRRDIIQILRDENELLKVRNQQLGSKLARFQQAFRVLNDIDEQARKISSKTDIEQLIRQLLELVLHSCNSENGSLILLDEEARELEFVEVIGTSRDALLNHRISIDTGISGDEINTCQAVLIENVNSEIKWFSPVDEYLGFHTESMMCAPLKVDNRIIGAIELVHHAGDNPFDENDLNVLRVAACYVGRALERAENIMLPTGDE